MVLNATDKRLIEFVANGKNELKKVVKMTGLKCLAGDCALELLNGIPIEADFRYWSDVSNWANSVLPKEGDYVEIQPGWNMVLDVAETPMLKSLQVNGRLQFINSGLDIHLRSKQIFVHTGEFLIGNSTHPFTANAKITLGGKQNETDLFLQGGSITVGNKIFATVSNVELFGKKRNRMTRLTKTAYMRDTEILVETGLDW